MRGTHSIVTAAAIAALSGAAIADPDAGPDVGPETIRLDIEECVARALSNSDQIAAEKHRIEALAAQVEEVFWSPLSHFSASGFFSVVPDKCVDQEWLEETGSVRECQGGVSAEEDYDTSDWGPTLRFDVSGGIPIITFGKWLNGKRAIESAHEARKAQLPALRHQIELQVRQLFHTIVGAREMLLTIEEGRGHLVKVRRRVEENLENEEGTETQVDLIKLKVYETEVDHLEVQARELEQTALSALRFLVGGDDRRRLDIVDEPQTRVEEEVGPLEEYEAKAVEHRPELAALKHAVRAMESKVDMQFSEFWPNILLVGGFRYGWTPGRDKVGNWALKDNYNYGPGWGIGLTLEWKLDWITDYYRWNRTKAELAALLSDQKVAFDSIMLEVEQAHLRALGSRDGLEALLKSKRLVKGWVAAVTQGHAAGLSTAKEVKDALKEYFTVMAGIYRLTGEYNADVAELHEVTGTWGADEGEIEGPPAGAPE